MIDTVQQLLHRHRFILLWVGFAATVLLLLDKVRHGASPPYPILDILISNAGGPVRRGFGGSAVLHLSQALGGTPELWAWALAAAVFAILTGLTTALYRRLPDDPAFLPLVLGPAGLLFFAYDPVGSLRKEIVGYLALVLVLHAGLARRGEVMRMASGAGAVVFLGALSLHEGLIFLWPALAAALWLMVRAWPGARTWALGLAGATGLGGGLMVLYVVRLEAPDPQAICVAAGLAECGEPFTWLTQELEDAVAYAYDRRQLWHALVFSVLATLALAPVLTLRPVGLSPYVYWAAVGGSCLAVGPLFVVGYDWGRWIQMAVFPLSLLATSAVVQGVARIRYPVPAWVAVLYVTTWSLPHATPRAPYSGVTMWVALGGVVVLHMAWARLSAWVGRKGEGASPSGQMPG